MDNKELGLRVKELRQKRGWSQEELAENSGLSLRTVQRIEGGETEPRGDTLKRLAESFGVSPDEIIDWASKEDRRYLVMINLSALVFMISSLFGVILPLLLWVSKKGMVKDLNRVAKSVINFQLTLFLAGLVVKGAGVFKLASVMKMAKMGGVVISPAMITSTIKYIIVATAILYAYNIVFIVVNTVRVSQMKNPVYFPSIRFLK